MVNLAKFGGTIGEALPKFTYVKNYAMYSELIFVGYKKYFTKWKQETQILSSNKVSKVRVNLLFQK